MNGPIVSACSAALWGVESDGYGMPRTMFGPKSTPNTSSDGFMSTPVKKPGITRDSTPRDGARRCLIVSLSPPMVPQMLLVDTYGKRNMLLNATNALKKSYYIL